MRNHEFGREATAWAEENRTRSGVSEVGQRQKKLMNIHDRNCVQPVGLSGKDHTGIHKGSRWSISRDGLLDAALNIFLWGGKASLVLMLSVIISLLFWYIRGWIPYHVTQSYKNYVIWLDTSIFGFLPSLWIQQHCRNELLDILMRDIWLSYGYVILFGSTIVFSFRGQVQRHILSVSFTLFLGLVIHYLIPTQPPWMAVDGLIRVTGDHLSSLDMNPVAAMPSIHQAIICLAGCALWQYGTFARLMGMIYNVLMATSLVYLGEHFLADSIAGIVIAVISWLAAGQISLKFKKVKSQPN